MDRHVALTWNIADEPAGAVAQQLAERLPGGPSSWNRVLDNPGVTVFQTGSQLPRAQAYILTGQAGVVLGKVFHRQSDTRTVPPDTVFGEAESERLLASAGRGLMERYWGRYTAFLHDCKRRRIYILRDPSAGRPSYAATLGRVRIFFSDVEDVFGTGLFPAAVNWDYVAAFLQCRARFGETGLVGVAEIRPGECVELDGDVWKSAFYWDPRNICRSDRSDDFDAAAAALRRTTQFCVNAWASSCRNILHNLSGGFDSAVVLACLRKSPDPPKITCLNRYQSAAEGDERRFAQLMAQRAQCHLVENEMIGSAMDVQNSLLSARRTIRPLRHPFGLADAPFRDQLALELGADSLWTGQAGDELFFRQRTRLVATDYAQDFGLGRPLLRVAHATARTTRETFWAVLGTALRHAVLGREVALRPSPFELPRFIADAAPPMGEGGLAHPWLESMKGVPAGKMIQIQALVSAFQLHDLHPPLKHADWLHPLLSQPLIELCLRIPSYLLAQGGTPRALAKQAFAADLPPQILTRETKGTMPTYYIDLLASNAAFLRSFLLDGQLAARGLLERKALERFFAAHAPIRPRELGPVVFCIGAEAWARSWASSSPARADAL
ncbi:MAG: asparagine synthase C-terminal domain-containing protein [Aliidongia sp.]